LSGGVAEFYVYAAENRGWEERWRTTENDTNEEEWRRRIGAVKTKKWHNEEEEVAQW